MKKLSKEELKQISDEILEEKFSHLKEGETAKNMAEGILTTIEIFILKYQERVGD